MAKARSFAGQSQSASDDPFVAEEITPANEQAESVPVMAKSPEPANSIDVKSLLARIEHLESKLAAQPTTTTVVLKDSAEERDRISREYMEKCGRPLDVRVQEIADEMYKADKDDNRFAVVLKDGNGHPTVKIPAKTPADARGRYMELCGIKSCDMTKFDVQPVAA